MQRVLLVPVTQAHINCGRRMYGDTCPVALALLDAGFPGAWVGTENATLLDADWYYDVPTSNFIHDFDTYGPPKVQPFTAKLVWETPNYFTVDDDYDGRDY